MSHYLWAISAEEGDHRLKPDLTGDGSRGAEAPLLDGTFKGNARALADLAGAAFVAARRTGEAPQIKTVTAQ